MCHDPDSVQSLELRYIPATLGILGVGISKTCLLLVLAVGESRALGSREV